MSKKTEIKSFDQQLTDWRKQFNKEIPERVGLAFYTNDLGEVEIEVYMTDENPTTRKIRVVRSEGKRQVNREIQFYNLDMVISVGLPAEIQARRRQYEYYRGKLLDFKMVNG